MRYTVETLTAGAVLGRVAAKLSGWDADWWQVVGVPVATYGAIYVGLVLAVLVALRVRKAPQG